MISIGNAHFWLYTAVLFMISFFKKGIYANMKSNVPAANGDIHDSSESVEDVALTGPSTTDDESSTELLLSKAASCLYRAVFLSKPPNEVQGPDIECYEDALVSLIDTKIEMNDAVGALDLCKLLLDDSKTDSTQAICKLYAAEAYCILGDSNEASVMMFGAKHADSGGEIPSLNWLAEGFGIDENKRSEGMQGDHDSQTLKVERLLKNKVFLYQALQEGDVEAAVNMIRGGDNVSADG